ncbi:MAG: NAD(P)(+) transhydrogenase (Re/Si-specific) subunit beta [Thermoleophilaceae bacterium]|nr:NAD(P)(+) transhydrogenase (Re/Si-specific) subunit beta [Thermoleophilaceae bacterium]
MTPLASFSLSNPNMINFAYLVAAALFIVGLRDLNSPATARRGNFIAGIGMFIALVFTLLDQEIVTYTWIIVGSVIGTAVGVWSARSVKMTAMPQMVALFNGVGGGAVALIALSEYHVAFTNGVSLATDHEVAILFSLIIGSVSFWGSNIAFMKLQELMSGAPKKAPGHRAINAGLVVVILATAAYLVGPADTYIYPVSIALLAGILGIMLVLPIGGADMPVVISTLNAMTGLAAAAAGFALDNTVLIVAGAIVGASGSILTNLMAKAMNRSIGNVLFGSFGGAGDAVAGAAGATHDGTVRSTSAADAAILMAYAQDVIVVPGYGLAVAQAQHTVREMAEQLEKKGVNVKYAIHPVAGRMPGHMNVLLAEADVDYSQLVEMEDINPEFARAQVALVVGANDVTNPAAKTPGSSIYGMPILEVADADNIIVLKRGMNPGYAGIENELYFNPKTQMLFGDAKDSLAEVVTELKNL